VYNSTDLLWLSVDVSLGHALTANSRDIYIADIALIIWQWRNYRVWQRGPFSPGAAGEGTQNTVSPNSVVMTTTTEFSLIKKNLNKRTVYAWEPLWLSNFQPSRKVLVNALNFEPINYCKLFFPNKKHLKNVGPIRNCEPPHCHSPGVATVARRHCRTPPAQRCPQQQRRQRQQRQRVTEGTAMAHRMGPKNYLIWCRLKQTDMPTVFVLGSFHFTRVSENGIIEQLKR